MRYVPMILSTALLLSAGLLVSTSPAAAPCPRSRWIVLLSPTRCLRRLATTTVAVTTDHTLMAIDLTGPITAMATDGPIMVMGMDVVGATETRPRPATPNSIAGAELIRWRNLGKVARHRSSPAGEPGSRPSRVAGFLASRNPPWWRLNVS